MQFGVVALLDDRSVPITDLARAVEAAGLESLFLTEHTHVPVRRETDWPSGRIPRDEARFLDPLVALTAAAMVTNRIRVGTGVCLVSERDPIVLAKQIATLDHLSNGRCIFGVGAGWVKEELRNHGTDPNHRWGIAEERVRAIREIWTHDEAEFHGRYVNFDAIWSWPKPVQRPHPPILIGGNGPRTLERVLTIGDGWMPVVTPNLNLRARIDELGQLAQSAGKAAPPTTACLWRLDEAQVRRAQADGARRCVVNIPVSSMREATDALGRYSKMVRDLSS